MSKERSFSRFGNTNHVIPVQRHIDNQSQPTTCVETTDEKNNNPSFSVPLTNRACNNSANVSSTLEIGPSMVPLTQKKVLQPSHIPAESEGVQEDSRTKRQRTHQKVPVSKDASVDPNGSSTNVESNQSDSVAQNVAENDATQAKFPSSVSVSLPNNNHNGAVPADPNGIGTVLKKRNTKNSQSTGVVRAYRLPQHRQPASQKQPQSIESILSKNRLIPSPPQPSLLDIADKLDFDVRPRPKRDGQGYIQINDKNALKITSDMKYLMMLYAIDMGYSISEKNNPYVAAKQSAKSSQSSTTQKTRHNAPPNPSLTTLPLKSKKRVHEAACKIVCYDYGLKKVIGATTLTKAFETFRKQKYSSTVNIFETRHSDRGRKSYIQKLEESYPGYLKSLFLYAKEQSDEYTKYDDYRKIMVERSKKLKPELDLKLTINNLMQFFEKNPKLKPRGMPKRKRPAGSHSAANPDMNRGEYNNNHSMSDALGGGVENFSGMASGSTVGQQMHTGAGSMNINAFSFPLNVNQNLNGTVLNNPGVNGNIVNHIMNPMLNNNYTNTVTTNIGNKTNVMMPDNQNFNEGGGNLNGPR